MQRILDSEAPEDSPWQAGAIIRPETIIKVASLALSSTIAVAAAIEASCYTTLITFIA